MNAVGSHECKRQAMSASQLPLLIAPDSFKGTFSAAEVAAAIGAGVRQAGWTTDICPVADGGEGTLSVLSDFYSTSEFLVPAHDALGRPIQAPIGITEDGNTAMVETAAAIGLQQLDPAELDAERASSYGAGELIAAALSAGAKNIIIAVGGSATSDGGAGALEALSECEGSANLIVLCDVRTPWEDAARIYAPQKGADAQAVKRLGIRLDELAPQLDRDPRGVAMTGAAGGLSGALWAQHAAKLTPGAAWILDTLGFDARARASRAVITGEGRLDPQTLAGKVVGELSTRARQMGVPVHAIVGRDALDRFNKRILDLQRVAEATDLGSITEKAKELGIALAQNRA